MDSVERCVPLTGPERAPRPARPFRRAVPHSRAERGPAEVRSRTASRNAAFSDFGGPNFVAQELGACPAVGPRRDHLEPVVVEQPHDVVEWCGVHLDDRR